MNTNKNLIALLCFSTLGMSGLVVYAVHFIPDTPTIVQTMPISKDQPIGGVATPSAVQQPLSPQSSDKPGTAQPVALSVREQPKSTPSLVNTRLAPEQAEITKTIDKEYPYRAFITPNDPYYNHPTLTPWALTRTGAPAAWDQTTGAPVIIAVIDTGFALQHEDLTTQWYQNPGETGTTSAGDTCWTGASVSKAANNCDDDTNGYIDDWRGWNFYGRYQSSADPCSSSGLGTYVSNNNPQAGQSGDDILYREFETCNGYAAGSAGDPYIAISHGTSTAGLAGAATNNSKGIATMNWNAKIMPLQALGDDGSGWTSSVTSAVRYAVDNGASVISLSLGGMSLDPALQGAIDYAYSHDVIVVAAAGNCGTGQENGCDPTKPGEMGYPALFPHVISVGATDATDTRASFSSYGPGLDVVGPGSGAIVSPLIARGATPSDATTFNYTSAYAGSLYGTSFAAPIVANIASIIRGHRPTATVDEVTGLIDGAAVKPSGMSGYAYTNQYGHGVINANAALTIASSFNQISPSQPTLGQTGDHRSEHSFSASATMSSGCTTIAQTYCTVRMTNPLGYDRYLPYSKTTTTGTVGWQWSGSILGNGEWSVRATQGTAQSPSYFLFSK